MKIKYLTKEEVAAQDAEFRVTRPWLFDKAASMRAYEARRAQEMRPPRAWGDPTTKKLEPKQD